MGNKNHKDYLAKTFLEELNYKIWTTKGSRFNANKRLLKIYRYSNLANSMLSVYLIAIGLLSVYNLYSKSTIDQNLLAYAITCLSILLLVFGQIENSKNYQLKAKEFHSCGIELSKTYNKLRIFKTLKENPTNQEKESFAQEISEEYESILKKFDNHEPIDFSMFKTINRKYFELNQIDVLMIKIRYLINTQLIFQLMIFLPPFLIGYILFKV